MNDRTEEQMREWVNGFHPKAPVDWTLAKAAWAAWHTQQPTPERVHTINRFLKSIGAQNFDEIIEFAIQLERELVVMRQMVLQEVVTNYFVSDRHVFEKWLQQTVPFPTKKVNK